MFPYPSRAGLRDGAPPPGVQRPRSGQSRGDGAMEIVATFLGEGVLEPGVWDVTPYGLVGLGERLIAAVE